MIDRLVLGYVAGLILAVAYEDKVKKWNKRRNDPFARTREQIQQLPTHRRTA